MTRILGMAATLLAMAATASPAAASSDGLVGRWRLNEGHGTLAADSSGYGDNGTVLGGATWAAGPAGLALSFDGAGSEVKVPDAPQLEPTASVSVGAWVESPSSPGDYKYILAKGGRGCTAASYGLYSGPNGGLQFYISRNGGQIYARSPDAGPGVWDGRWHFVVGTFNGTTIRLYVDGSEIGSGTNYPGPLEYLLRDSNDLIIGDYPSCSAEDFSGSIDDVMVWSRALTADEVHAMNQPSSPLGPWGSNPLPGDGNSTGQGPAAGAGAEVAPPVLGVLRVSPSKVRNTAVGRRSARGPTITYTDSQPASTTFRILRPRTGALRRGCMNPARHKRWSQAGRCMRYVAVGSFSHRDHGGHNRLRFPQLLWLRLTPGSYLLAATPRANGRVGSTVDVAFNVVR